MIFRRSDGDRLATHRRGRGGAGEAPLLALQNALNLDVLQHQLFHDVFQTLRLRNVCEFESVHKEHCEHTFFFAEQNRQSTVTFGGADAFQWWCGAVGRRRRRRDVLIETKLGNTLTWRTDKKKTRYFVKVAPDRGRRRRRAVVAVVVVAVVVVAVDVVGAGGVR